MKTDASVIIDLDYVTDHKDKFEESDIKYLGDAVDRLGAYNQIVQILYDMENAAHIEASIFEFTLVYAMNRNYKVDMYYSIYMDKLNDILYNIDPASTSTNSKLIKRIKQNKINVRKIAFMTPQQLFPKNWKNEIDIAKQIEKRKNTTVTSDLYTCEECGSKRCTAYERQMRGADEPMTNFVTCLECRVTKQY